MLQATRSVEVAVMEEHDRQVVKVADWLADGWDWDQIGAAMGLDADAAYQQFGEDALAYHRAQAEAQAREHGSAPPGTAAQ
jgi:hypothetical protein